MKYHARVHIQLRPSIFDPQASVLEAALQRHRQGDPVTYSQVRLSKVIEFDFDTDSGDPKTILETVSREFLANPIVETFEIHYKDLPA